MRLGWVFMVIVVETLCVCSVWKKLSSESGCERKTYSFWVLFCSDKKPISFGTVCDINQMGSGVAVAGKAVMTKVYGTRILLPYPERDSCAEIIFTEQLSFVSQCGVPYLHMLCADDCGMRDVLLTVFTKV